MSNLKNKVDIETAQAFAGSWNNLPSGSIYTKDQFEDWMLPLTKEEVAGKRVLELGCGNASLMVHMAEWNPSFLEGVDLGDSVKTAVENMNNLRTKVEWKISQEDLTEYNNKSFDLVYCIGVLHHLKDMKKGFDTMVSNVVPGGRFHAWVYAREGNGVIVWIVDPIRKIVSHFPWWAIKYLVATPLVIPYYLYAKILCLLPRNKILEILPLYQYSLWIGKREFGFFRHVAFDQLVTPQTSYLPKETIVAWLRSVPNLKKGSGYIIRRNGNSWKFGGQIA